MKTSRLEKLRQEVRGTITQLGLDPYPVEFGLVSKERMDEISAYDGFPERYPHWKFGMKYDQQRKKARYGGMKIYELVVNSSPALAYLREDNSVIQNKAIMAHVYAHSDFFKNNRWFFPTREDMVKVTREHGNRVEKLMGSHGVSRVESFLDRVLSLQFNIDQYLPYQSPRKKEETKEAGGEKIPVKRDYMDRFINPPEWVEQDKGDGKNEKSSTGEEAEQLPTTDILGFLAENGDLKSWEKDIISLVREESYYFAPQLMTKVMNEGWAAYWQSRVMNEEELAEAEEFLDHADMLSRVLAGRGLNPYLLGKKIWEDVRERWNKGRHGREWENCSDRKRRERWDREEGRGLEKMLELRKNLNDVSFIDAYFTEEVLEGLNLFTYEWLPKTGNYHITARDFDPIKKKLLFRFTNLGRPTIKVKTGNFENKSELLLVHEFNGVNLHLPDGRKVLKNIYEMWGRPVNLKTVQKKTPEGITPEISGEEPKRKGENDGKSPDYEGLKLRYDGEEFQKEEVPEEELDELMFETTDYDTVPRNWKV